MKRKNLEKIKGEIESLVLYAKKRENIEAIYLFGSSGTEYETAFSDIDIAILYGTYITLEEELSVECDICKIFSRDNIDVVSLNKVPVNLQFEIISTGDLIYCKDNLKLVDFIESVINFYQDYSYTLESIYNDMIEG